MILYRPVGLEELLRIADAEMRAFPPRQPEQPIFYPVLNEEYARQIAGRWNTKDNSRVGFVTRFDVDDAYVSRFEPQIVGGRVHEELWVPAEQLEEFNQHITDRIEVVAVYFGDGRHDLVADAEAASSLFRQVAEDADERGDPDVARVLRDGVARLDVSG